ncbi:hypothetical protein NDU88_010149, partial [Pleurodeles waltl]
TWEGIGFHHSVAPAHLTGQGFTERALWCQWAFEGVSGLLSLWIVQKGTLS